MPSAHVQSIQQLADFQSALAGFTQQVKEAVLGIGLEIRRQQDWLEHQLKFWQTEVRKAEEDVYKAKQELARRRLMRTGDRPVDTTEQELALAKAQRRLAFAEDKRDVCRQWTRKLPDALEEYEGQAMPMQHLLESEVPRMLAFLDRKMDILETYIQSAAAPAREETP